LRKISERLVLVSFIMLYQPHL